MIYGRKQLQFGNEKIWDYVACLYPEGNFSDDYNVFFDHSDIENVYFKGYEDEDEIKVKKLLSSVKKFHKSV